MKKRWISLLVENEIGVLAKISGLFAGKAYNLNSLTVGRTEDETVSRMTISLTSDDRTFEQVKKQLNRSVEVIKVVDLTDVPIHRNELMFVKLRSLSAEDKTELFRIAEVYPVKVMEFNPTSALLQSVRTEEQNNELIDLLSKWFVNRIEIARGGSVGMEVINL